MSDQPQAPWAEILRTRDFVGWEVVDREGAKVGSVADLLIDRDGRIRFLDVEYGFPKKHILLPQDQLEWGESRFAVGGWADAQLKRLPNYDPGRVLEAPLLEEMGRAFPWMYGEMPPAPAAGGDARVLPLSQAKDFKLSSGAPDLKGWNVFASDGERVGTVAQMLVDPALMKIRYLDVDLLDDLFLLGDDRHVLLPLGDVELKERGNDVWVRALTAREVAELPAYPGGAVDPWMEQALAERFGRPAG